MTRNALLAVLVVLSGALALAPAADAHTRRQAQLKARRAADHYTGTRYGISGGGARYWRARCHRTSGGWSCRLRFNEGECVGRLKLRDHAGRRMHAYAFKIGCME